MLNVWSRFVHEAVCSGATAQYGPRTPWQLNASSRKDEGLARGESCQYLHDGGVGWLAPPFCVQLQDGTATMLEDWYWVEFFVCAGCLVQLVFTKRAAEV